jgi:hypothetical protein
VRRWGGVDGRLQMEMRTLRVDKVPSKAAQVGAGGKEKGDDDGHPAVASSSFSSDAATPPSERTQSRCPLTTIPGWDLEGRLLARSCSDKTRKMANVVVDGYRIVESFSQSLEVHKEDHGYATRGGGAGHDRAVSEDQLAHALRSQGDHPTQGAALIREREKRGRGKAGQLILGAFDEVGSTKI